MAGLRAPGTLTRLTDARSAGAVGARAQADWPRAEAAHREQEPPDAAGITGPAPIWSDTRSVDPYAPTNGVVHDEDVFTDNVGLPNGQAKLTVGTIGYR